MQLESDHMGKPGSHQQMKTTISALTICFFLLISCLCGDTWVNRYPVDAALGECLQNHPSSDREVACLEQACEGWNREMIRIFDELTEKLGQKKQLLLREAQRAWISYRDLHFAYLDEIFPTSNAIMNKQRMYQRYEFIKKRAIELLDLDYVSRHNIGISK